MPPTPQSLLRRFADVSSDRQQLSSLSCRVMFVRRQIMLCWQVGILGCLRDKIQWASLLETPLADPGSAGTGDTHSNRRGEGQCTRHPHVNGTVPGSPTPSSRPVPSHRGAVTDSPGGYQGNTLSMFMFMPNIMRWGSKYCCSPLF